MFGTASYYVQKLFSEFQGVRYIDTTVSTPEHDPRDHGIAASATCQDEDCTQLAFKASLHMPFYLLTLLKFCVACGLAGKRHVQLLQNILTCKDVNPVQSCVWDAQAGLMLGGLSW